MAERKDEWYVERDDILPFLLNDAYGGKDTSMSVYVDERDPLADLDRIAHRLNTYDALVQALEEIQKGEGPYKRDPLEHATNVIARHIQLATEALRLVKGEQP